MRDPNRIAPFMSMLEALWRAHPDLRFGQLIVNLVGDEDGYEWDVEEFAQKIREADEMWRPLEDSV